MVEKALAIDSGYALAWEGLGWVESQLYHYGYKVDADQKKSIKEAYDKALVLRPDLIEVQMSIGSYLYTIKKDYPKALKIYEKLERQYPKRRGPKGMIGLTHRRLGNFEKAEQIYKEIVTLHTTSVYGWYNYGQILTILRKYSEAERAFKEVITLNPSFAR